MKSLFCLKCLCCCDLPDCADFMNAIGMPYPDHGCSDYKWAGLREVFCWLLVLYALKDFLIKRLGSLLEHTT